MPKSNRRLHFVKECRLADTNGVEQWLLDGALLMKLLKAGQPARSDEDEAAALRLRTIVHRGKAGASHDSPPHTPPELREPPEAPDVPQ